MVAVVAMGRVPFVGEDAVAVYATANLFREALDIDLTDAVYDLL
jgi:hypothetical protein